MARSNGFHPDEDSADETSEDEARELPSMSAPRVPLDNRPPSSLSSQQRYRTPLAGSMAFSPTPSRGIPTQQPQPAFETPSAFAEVLPRSPSNPQYHPHHSVNHLNSADTTLTYRGVSRDQMRPYTLTTHGNPPATALERAVESVQVHLAALNERLETLEARSLVHSRSQNNSGNLNGPPVNSWLAGATSNNARGTPQWDIDDLGMWSIVLNPLSRGLVRMKELATFFARNEDRSPSMIIVRRLCLDVSFLLTVIMIVGGLWRKSGVRRREVRAALVILWKAIVGSNPPRRLSHHSG